MVIVLITLFIVGYACIALEHPLKVNKTATALLLGTALWAVFSFCNGIFRPDLAADEWRFFVTDNLIDNLGETAEIVFFLMGAMTIVTLIEDYQGFRIITDKIVTTNKKKLLWELSILTFFLSALLDAWSPIGDVTTIMLWIGGQVTTINIMVKTLVASLVCMAVPVLVVGATLKGDITRPESEQSGVDVPVHLRRLILIMGIAALIFVPIFKTITHLPPYLGMLFGLGVLWVTTEIVSRKYEKDGHKLPTAVSTLEHIDVPTILFFLGILMAVACLKDAGILASLASGLDNAFLGMKMGNEPVGFFIIDLIIGVLSSVVDNVPLVAAVMGMYPLGDGALFDVNHPFWEFLAYCAGTGGSLLIIGSAAGVAVMGMEKIDFIWYLKNITLKALVGYLAGAIVFVLMDVTLFEKVEWLRNLA